MHGAREGVGVILLAASIINTDLRVRDTPAEAGLGVGLVLAVPVALVRPATHGVLALWVGKGSDSLFCCWFWGLLWFSSFGTRCISGKGFGTLMELQIQILTRTERNLHFESSLFKFFRIFFGGSIRIGYSRHLGLNL